MLSDRELEKTIIYKCKQCGLSDTRLKDTKQVPTSSKKSVNAKTKGGNNINEKIIGLTLQQEF